MNQTNLPPVVSVVGRPKVGKTTFLAKLIAELTRRGYRVGVIKHSVHEFDVAQAGKDTWQHAQAGAKAVAFASAKQLVITRSVERELSIDEVAAMLGNVDIILTEGYKHADKHKIEISRRELGTTLVSRRKDVIAVVSDHDVDLSVPRFNLEDIAGVTLFLQARYLS